MPAPYFHLTNQCVEHILKHQERIFSWLESLEHKQELPLYSSVDIRDAGFKACVVDTNLFPAGFNNLCEHGRGDAAIFMKTAVLRRIPNARRVLIIAEEHTRNTWYLENIRILEQIIQAAGFQTKIATFLSIQPDFCQCAKFVELETATGQSVRIHCFKRVLEDFQSGKETFDLIIMNNDLTTGIPDVLRQSTVPIYPSIQAGWHARLKSHHFCHANKLFKEFGQLIGLDPWLFSALYNVAEKIDINSEADRSRLQDMASDLLRRVSEQYRSHGIQEKPFIFIKSDSGTYGMGVLPVEDASDILKLNSKDRKKLHVGKNSQVIERYLLQEGVPTIYKKEGEVAEVCIYQIENNLIGGFYRTNSQKNSRENLNSQGMAFKTMCPHLSKYGQCGVHHDVNIFDVYRILARVAAIAAHREIVQLENQSLLSECN